MRMTREQIIADERYHTCGRCRWRDLNDDSYPCNKCIHSADKREDFWQYAEEVENGMTIEKAVEYNKNLKMYMEINDKHDEYKFLEENHIALEMAINTMRKYQTMQEVLEKVWNVPSCMLDEAECLNEIMETYRTVR